MRRQRGGGLSGAAAGAQEQLEAASERSRTCKFLHMLWNLVLFMVISMMICVFMWLIYLSIEYYACNSEYRFAKMRIRFIERERRRQLGGRMPLSPLEHEVNQQLMAMKLVDEQVWNIWRDYQPRPHFLSKYQINETLMYNLLRAMPKGGLLHVHDAGMFKTDLLCNLTLYSDLWACIGPQGSFEDFRFSKSHPKIPPQDDYFCNWMLMRNFRLQSDDSYEKKLHQSLSLDAHSFMNASHLAQHMKRAHRLIYGLVTYRPIWPTFLMNMLEDFYNDGVNYIELRSSLPVLYDLEGSNFTILDTAFSVVTATNIFRSSHTDFIGMKLIYAPVRQYNDSKLNIYLRNAQILKAHFPNFVVGFDLIHFGNECDLPALSTNLQLLHISKEIDFYFHAGESRCVHRTAATEPDENLIDALLLGSKRIGNALNLPLHPEVLKAMRRLNVAAEVCPLSNHYMQYVNDMQQHPAAYLIAAGYPMVIGSDYPYLWNAAPLTDDFYVAFVGIANSGANLRLLKQLALNSFLYSSLHGDEKAHAIAKWRRNWDQWIVSFVSQG
ncbi:adenosine deaminase 2 [Drosophila busckii]|uniref:adenosine deaminase 2 n=1 Tax=Drosophila busckii TaxID=30019 RepID=UPI001432A3AE|nr:adenosine deaminase 2 [Drosophila busckii]